MRTLDQILWDAEDGHLQEGIDGFSVRQRQVAYYIAKQYASQYIELLDQIATDLADYQNENGIGTMDDAQWQQVFVDRVTATITSYETKEF